MSGDPASNGRPPAGAPGTLPAGPAGAGAGPAHAAPPSRALPGGGETRRHVLVAVVLNKPGVLNRVSSLMRARNFNIDSLAVSHTDSDEISRMTITLHGDDVAVEQAAKQLYRLIDVLKVQDVTAEPTVQQELALVKIRATESSRAEVLRLVEVQGVGMPLAAVPDDRDRLPGECRRISVIVVVDPRCHRLIASSMDPEPLAMTTAPVRTSSLMP